MIEFKFSDRDTRPVGDMAIAMRIQPDKKLALLYLVNACSRRLHRSRPEGLHARKTEPEAFERAGNSGPVVHQVKSGRTDKDLHLDFSPADQ
jgi:hypothetical protein